MTKSVSLIIAFYNKIELLRLILTALERQTYLDFEVVIADDGSRSDVIEEIAALQKRFPFTIKHVWHEDNGWQKNKILNQAVVASEGEYLVFIDGDCIPHPRFIQEHVESRSNNQIVSGRRVMLTDKVSQKLTVDKIKKGYLDCAAFFPLLFEVLFTGQKCHLENMIRIRNKTLRKLFIKDKPRGFWGCNFSLWKRDILLVNGFDERFVYPGTGEDADLEDRLGRLGIKPLSKKHMITQYHVYHKHFDTRYEPNILLREENNRNLITYTPYGINKKGQ